MSDDSASVDQLRGSDPHPHRSGGEPHGGDPVAIVGMACRFPGGVCTPDELWELALGEQDAISPFPSDRGWDTAALFDPDPAAAGRSYVRVGGFLDDAGGFDADFFHISPREAAAMDPQQRLLLETAWEALEHAGLPPDSLAGSDTGVFVGIGPSGYAGRSGGTGADAAEGYRLTALSPSVASGRIAHVLGLHGPAVSVDTASSSSLVALHQAVQSICAGECGLALVGGVAVLATPEPFVEHSRLRGLAPDGRCKPFADAADGTAWGEGVGLLVLERLSQARRRGHQVLALIRGSAIASDGATDGLTTPSGAAQQRVIRTALTNAGVRAADIDFVEAHGTGTVVGDPVEAHALLATYGRNRPPQQPLWLGSIKSVIGHTQAAAGIAGVIKTVQALRHGVLPPTLHIDRPSTRVDWSGGAVQPLTRRRAWRTDGRPRRAGVSSFGISGTNAHVILEQALQTEPAQAAATGPALPWVLSARSHEALAEQARRLAHHLDGHTGFGAAQVGWSLLTSRALLEHRAVIVGDDAGNLRAGLDAVACGAPRAEVVSGVAAPVGGTVFVFPGQGAQWLGMGRELLDSAPVFARRIEECDAAFAPLVEWSLVDVLRGGGPRWAELERVDVVQPALFAVMVALAELWASLGVRPDAVVGHSQGEVAAACVAGALSLADAAAVVVARSRLVRQELSGRGGMVSVALPPEAVGDRLRAWGEALNVAAVNGPEAVVVSGDNAALHGFLEACARDGVRATRIAVDYASHCARVDPLRDRLLRALAAVTPRSSRIAFYSTVSGTVLDTAELDAGYWFRNLREPVQFAQATIALLRDGHTVFVESSPHPVLTPAVAASAETCAADTENHATVTVTGTLRRDDGGFDRLLISAAQLFVTGVPVHWHRLFDVDAPTPPVPLPTYAFQHRRYWLGAAPTPPSTDTAPGAVARQTVPTPSTTLAARLGGLTQREQARILLDFVRARAALVLGHDDTTAIEPDRTFTDLGVDSLTAVETRTRLAHDTGLTLPTTVLYEHPTPRALARLLQRMLDKASTAEAVQQKTGAVGPTAETAGPTAESFPHSTGTVRSTPETVQQTAETAPETVGAAAGTVGSAAGTEPTDATEPIAIIGIGCRYPGGADDADGLWDLVSSGRDAISEFPTDRGWDLAALFDQQPDTIGISATRRGGFLGSAGDFDAEFFGIGPREALAMDPQQRLVLETAWEALEHAGIDPVSLCDSDTGIFLGVMEQGYGSGVNAAGLTGYRLTGAAASVVSGRLAYVLGTQGQAVSVDTACSSSLVALHQAVRALRAGECAMALAGGVTVMATPGLFVEFSRHGGVAADGRCKSFAASADGTGWSEGAGMLVLQRLSDAQRAGHQILAVVRGSAVTADGASNGLTAPNGGAQQRVIRRALADAGLDAGDVDAVEAHGTGTVLGDPIEADALVATYGQGRPANRPLWLGSIKSNIGHSQAAAGVAGVIKMVQALRHGVLPRTLHVTEPSPHVNWSDGAIALLIEQRRWPDTGRPRRAGVSSFGISGTNAHLILEEAPAVRGELSAAPAASSPVAWVLSARSRDALLAQADRLALAVRDRRPDPIDVGWSLALRTRFEHRLVVLGAEDEQISARLTAFAEHGSIGPGMVSGKAGPVGGTVFVFPGQGAQWVGMGRALLEIAPVFAAAIDECADAFSPAVGWSLHEILHAEEDDATVSALLERVDVVQPVLFAVMVGLARWWQSIGVEPDAVIGHSQGEIAAAHIAGVLSLADAAHLVVARSRLIAEQLAGSGAMASVALSPADAAARLAAYGDAASIAAINGPAAVAISGDPAAVDAFTRDCANDGVQTGRIAVDYASHSHHVDALRDSVLRELAGITPQTDTIPFYSTVTGAVADTVGLGAGYWYDNLRRTVRFTDAVAAAYTDGYTAFLEISPHTLLTPGIEETLEACDTAAAVSGRTAPRVVVGSLRRGDRGLDRLLESAAHLHVAGAEVDWRRLFDGGRVRRIPLPTYPFQRRRYWLAPADDAVAGQQAPQAAEAPVREQADPLRRLDDTERARVLLALVREQAALVLGHSGPDAIDIDRTFKDMGFDSLAAVDARKRLANATGLSLPTTILYDHPTPAALAADLRRRLTDAPDESVSLSAVSPARTEPIAIVGIGCRFPGGASTPEGLWQLLVEEREAFSPFPDDRGWDLANLFDDDPDAVGRTYVREGGFLDDAADFDAEFFGISPREAVAMDPQQRLLLETAWEALEHAGIDPESLRGSDTGVFAGVTTQSYGIGPGDTGAAAAGVEGYRMTGTLPSVVSGRVAYELGLRGPAISVDTACSSSLTALHQAVQAVRAGECAMALAGGVMVMATPFNFVEFSRQGGMARDGRCKPFADAADGIGWGEGAGVLVIEPLSRARELGHEVLALIRGTAVNQDGASNGLSAPNGLSQQRVIRQALADAGLTADEVDAVEAHGTGTTLGDPIEAHALLATYGQNRPADRPLWLGSIKSNLGHTATAAGVAGVIKMVQALRHDVLPRTLHVDAPSRHIDWSSGALRLLTERRPWPEQGRPRRAGVSSFGISGTNAHIVLEQAPRPAVSAPTGVDGRGTGIAAAVPWVVSGRTREALSAQARRLREHLAAHQEAEAADVGWSLVSGRSQLPHRAVVVGADRAELLAGIHALADGALDDRVVSGVARGPAKTVFVFPGQGTQWVGMGRELLDTAPVFAATISDCADALAPWVAWSPRDVLTAPPQQCAALLERIDVLQPVLFSVMVALARVWQAAGVHPHAVVGHSQGEIAAAHIAGAVSLGDAMRLVVTRSRIFAEELAGTGAIASIALSREKVEQYLHTHDYAGLSVAGVNGPAAVSVAGPAGALDRLVEVLRADGARVRVVPATVPSHTPAVDRLRDRLLRELSFVSPRDSDIPLYSTVTGAVVAGTELTAQYWFDNCRYPVLFEPVVRTMRADGFSVFVEASPHPILAMHIEHILDAPTPPAGAPGTTAGNPSGASEPLNPAARVMPPTGTTGAPAPGASMGTPALPMVAAAPPVVVGTLRRDRGGLDQILLSAARLFVSGTPVRWAEMFTGDRRRIDLPTYAFQRQRYWLAPVPAGGDVAATGQIPIDHPLLAAAVPAPDGGGLTVTTRLSLRTHPWLADHALAGVVLFPGTGLLELAARAGAETDTPTVTELTLLEPLVVPDTPAGVAVQLRIGDADADGSRPVTIHSRATATGAWTRHAEGILSAHTPACAADTAAVLAVWPPAGAVAVDVDDLYDRLLDSGYEYGPLFHGLRAVWRRGDELYAEAALPEPASDAGRYGIHPALLDALLHAVAASSKFTAFTEFTAGPVLPFAWRAVVRYTGGVSVLRARIVASGADIFGLHACDEAGRPVLSVGSLTMRPARADRFAPASAALHIVGWTPVSVSAPRPVSFVPWGAVSSGDAPVGAEMVVFDLGSIQRSGAVIADTHRVTVRMLAVLQQFLGDNRYAVCRLVVVTSGAVATEDTVVTDPAAAAVWGLVRSAQTENPDRIVVVDTDSPGSDPAQWMPFVAACAEPQIVYRSGALSVARMTPVSDTALTVPTAAAWRLAAVRKGTPDGLALVDCSDSGAESAPVAAGEVRVAVRAAGLNFRDVLVCLNMRPGDDVIGSEMAGVVVETGPDAGAFAPGDRVMGLITEGIGPEAVVDHRLLVRIPLGWSFAEAATIPAAFSTAFYALRDLAEVQRGDRVLVHAATGGVGMAAVQLARSWGAEVFATASRGKWDALRRMGFDDDHIGDSRSLDFEQQFLTATDGVGVDVVLDCLAGDFVDASLRLLPRGGRFIEMGKTDIRDPEEIAATYPGVRYRAFDTMQAGPDRLQRILAELAAAFERGSLARLPLRAWDIRYAQQAFRYFARTRHTGKLVLTLPTRPDPDRTVLITGGTGVLGAALARHLVAGYGVRSLLLVSRQGPAAPGAHELVSELNGFGARVLVRTCDVTDRGAVAELLDSLPGDAPLGGVVHAAGVLDDGVITALSPARLDRVLAAKVDAAWYLHELTAHLDLDLFVLYSSAAGVLGAPGQGNYAAANTALDALAAQRRAHGLPAVSVVWGYWGSTTGMTAHLDEADTARITRSGLASMSVEQGLSLFDAALAQPYPAPIAARLDRPALAARARAGQLPPILRGLVAERRAVAEGDGGGLRRRLAGLPESEQHDLLLDLVRSHTAAVLGHTHPHAIDPHRTFADHGIDSLTAVETRNRLTTTTGLPLPTTLVFDHPTPTDTAHHLHTLLTGEQAPPSPTVAAAASAEPIAIVGIGCRFPGGVSDAADLWDLVAAGGDAISAFPTDRGWDLAALFDPEPGAPGTSTAREGGFLAGAADFDAEFFGISPREATAMDPQQRLVLETAWEAVENAGIEPGSLRGSDTGVFLGVIGQSYGIGYRQADTGEVWDVGHQSTGNLQSVVSGRVSYALGLTGPAISVDTACSSSLVALHQAVQSLRAGECEAALAGGVTVMSTPGAFVEFTRQGGLAPDGRCKPFAAAADGAGFAEGVGIVVVERLSRARALGHEVLAVVRGSAVNQDGASNGLSAPNGPAQQHVIRRALAEAGLTTSEVDAVEAHGTGTTLGDPIEAQALLATYGQQRPADRPLWLGSVKSNIGHTQAAAGIAGVIKMVQAMRHGVLPPTLHVDAPSGHVDWSAGAVELLTSGREWPRHGRARRAGVSSFGISGTNAHIILEQAPEPDTTPSRPSIEPVPVAWVLSARGQDAVARQARRLAEHLRRHPDLTSEDVGWTLSRRTRFEHRMIVVGTGREQLLQRLAAACPVDSGAGQALPGPGVVTGKTGTPGRIVFVFPGQGAQWVGMGHDLMRTAPVFADAVADCAAVFATRVDWSVVDLLHADADDADAAALLARVDVVQPVLFAVMAGLTAWWRSLGVVPDAVVGHSQGEIAAAYVAGALTLDEAAHIVLERSRVIAQELTGHGGMASVALSAAEVAERLAPYGSELAVAATNGPAATVVSGDTDALDRFLDACEHDGVRATRIAVDYASHCPRVERVRAPLLRDLDGLAPRATDIAFYSTVTGTVLGTGRLDAEYWYRNLREPVRYTEAVERLRSDGHTVFVEISPHPLLTAGIDTAESETAAAPATVVGSLRRGQGGTAPLLESAAHLDVAGVPVDWSAAFGAGARRVPLPAYAFRRRRYWPEPVSGATGVRGLPGAGHPLVEAVVPAPDTGGVTLLGRLSRHSAPWLADHTVGGAVLLPGTGLLELVMQAGQEVGTSVVDELILTTPLPVPSEGATRIQVVVGSLDQDARTVTVYSRADDGTWTTHARGRLVLSAGTEEPVFADLQQWPPHGAEAVDIGGLYDRLTERGYEYGPACRGLRAVWRDGDHLYAEASAARELTGTHRYSVHPALLDAVLHAVLADPEAAAAMPFAWTGVLPYATGAATLRARITRVGPRSYSVAAVDPAGLPVLSIRALSTRPVPAISAQVQPVAARHVGNGNGDAPQAQRLRGLDAARRPSAVLELVRTQVAVVLGHPSASDVDADSTFQDLGIDSVTAVEIRRSLAAATGLALPATLVFDHPTPRAVAARIHTDLIGAAPAQTASPGPAVDPAEPIAIVGLGCRFPGGVRTPDQLWRLLVDGTDAVTGFPADRGWDMANLIDPDPDAAGKTYVRAGGFLTDAALFDAEFFGIGPREATGMDPQQRLVLETVWEALEDAGIDPESLRGSDTGVFMGVMSQPYGAEVQPDVDGADVYRMTGMSPSVVSGRVAYVLGTEGPAVSVDTACSSSLVALHQAVQALRAGDCTRALVGGVTVMSTPVGFVRFARQRGLAPDGRCKPFAQAADGAGFAEGVGVLVVEPLSRARQDGHEVLAVVRGSAVNQDGASNGLTAPNGPAQQRVIRRALAGAGIAAGEVDVVEAHGTGTTLGDPIEAHALIATYGREHSADRPLWLGSIKSNIGHTQAAAGVAGVIKMVQALRYETLPRTLHIDTPSPHIDWSADTVRLLTEQQRWPRGERPRRAGVSSFGASGTNAHVILEEAPPPPARTPGCAMRTVPWVVTARSREALREQLVRLSDAVRGGDADPVDIGWTLAGRTRFRHRAVLVGSTREELSARLAGLATGEVDDGAVSGRAGAVGGTVFVFAGQGGQWVGMGRALLEESAVFAAVIEECAEAFAPWVEWSLWDVLSAGEGSSEVGGLLGRVDVVQPVLFAVMVGVARWWESVGVRADAVVGHSQGEVAAAYVAGGLSLEDAVRVVVARSRLISDQLTGAGAMASVALPAEKVAERLARYGQAVCVAAVNGPAAVVVSGDPDAVQRFVDDCARDGIRASHVAVDYASHSRHVEALREPLLRELADIVPRPAAIPFYSTVTGEETDTLGVDAEYWFGNLRRPVRFAEAVAAAADDGHTVFVEVGPHPLLTPGITAVLDERRGDTAAADTHPAGAVVGSLRRGDGGLDRLLRSAAHLHITGVAVDWSVLFEESGVQRVSLPTYAFQHRRYWLDPTEAADPVALGVTGAAHPLLAAVVADPGTGGATLTGLISLRSQPWLADHAVSETVLFPGTGFLELALRAGAEVDTPAVAELTLLAPLVLRAEEAVTIRVVVGAAENGLRPITIHGRVVDHGAWVRHAAGTLARDIAGTEDGSVPAPASAAEIDVDDLYDRLTALGCEYGPTFRGLRAVRRTGSDLYIDAALPHSASGARRYGVHPALLDAVLQAAVCLDTESEHAVTPLLPFTWTGVTRFATGATALRARIGRDTDTGALTLAVSDTAGRAVLSVRALTTRPVRLDLAATATVRLHTPIWKPAPVPPVQQPVSSMVWPEAVAAIEDGMDNPAVVVLDCRGRTTGTDPHAPVHEVLAVLQRFVTDERFTGSRLVVLTCGAVSVAGEDVTDLSGAAVWGLARSGQSEHPGRIVLADIGTAPDDVADVDEALAAVVSSADAEPQFAVRSGVVHVPRLTVPPADLLEPPASGIWRLDCPAPGTPDGLALTPHESAEPTLRAGQVQVGVRAAGLNFRDVMICLGVYPDPDVALGAEISGVVLAVGAGVDDIARGDRVMGLITGGIGPVAVTDHRSLVQVPPGWSFADAAATPVAFATAWYGLCDLAEVGPGDRVLIHAATGGVGMAALQLARLWGAEVFATASRGKWHILRELGFDDDHIGDSRGLDFAQQFLAATDGAGMDVVLDCLAGEFVDASLRLLPRGGRFVEMGKTDIRDPGEIAAEYPGVRYRAFDLLDAGSDRIGRILGDLFDLFIDGRLHRLPLRAWDIRQAPAAFRCFAQTRHTGKLVLTLPPAPTLEHGTVLVTGGTGGLGGVVARHLATRYQPRLLVLAGRRGPRAPGAEELARDLTALGTEVRVVACDVSDRAAVADLLASIPAHAPLTGIVHAAGVLDDGVIDSLTPERVSAVLAAKADAARHLHELTRAHDLTLFVLFSSAVGVLGSPGQGNYAAANSMVDALAAHRRAQGLVATSIAWGNWASVTAMTARLGAADTARMHRAGVAALDTEQGLALFDAAVTRAQATVAAVRFDRPALTAAARAGTLPPILRDLVTVGPRPASAPETSAQDLRRRLAGLPESEQRHELLNLVCSHTAAVLGHTHPHAIDPHRTFADHGIDSLTAVETRNRLTTTTGLPLPTTLVFDHPTPTDTAHHLHTLLTEEPAAHTMDEHLIRRFLASVPLERLREHGVLDTVLNLARAAGDPPPVTGPDGDDDELDAITRMDVGSLIRHVTDHRQA